MSSIPGSAVVAADQMRAFRGCSTITQEIPRGWFTAHTLQLSINRRFSRGLAYGFNDTIVLSQRGITGARLQPNPDGSFSERPDQPQATDCWATTCQIGRSSRPISCGTCPE